MIPDEIPVILRQDLLAACICIRHKETPGKIYNHIMSTWPKVCSVPDG